MFMGQNFPKKDIQTRGQPSIVWLLQMTPADLKSARYALGLSARGMADALGYRSPSHIRRLERGDTPIPQTVAMLVTIWSDPRCPKWARPDQLNNKPLDHHPA